MRAQWIAMGSVAVLLSVVPGSADAAKPYEHEHYSFDETESFVECGIAIDAHFVGGGNFLVREVEGSDGQAYLAHDNYWFEVTWTNADTGAWLLIRGGGVFKEMTATHVEGDIWEFTAMDAGQQFVIEDSDGNVVLRDRGRITFRALFDTLGDGEPGGELLEEEITGIHGPHPGLDADLCELAVDLIG